MHGDRGASASLQTHLLPVHDANVWWLVCRYPQLGSTLNYVQEIMGNASRSGVEVDGIPDDITFVTTQQPNASCLQEPGASYKVGRDSRTAGHSWPASVADVCEGLGAA